MTIVDPVRTGGAVLAAVPTRLLIDGEWRDAADAARMEVVNPATEEVITEVADASLADVQAATAAAAAAQASWAATPARVRSELLYRAYEEVMRRQDDLAVVMTSEMGKPLAEARGEVAYAAEFFRWFAEEAVRVDGGYSHRPDGTARTFVLKQPVGPCLLITPWNFPLAMGARKVAPAVAAGCTMVLKPAPQTPLTTLALAQILLDVGLPAGVLNVVPTSRAAEVVEPVLTGGTIRKLSFTGSTAVGKLLLEQASKQVVRTSLELGGNAPFIVFADADLDVAVEAAVQAKMRNMGEACTAANRIFVHRSVAEEFAQRLADRMGAMPVGDGMVEGTLVGPMIDAASRDKVVRLMEDAICRGARVVGGGNVPAGTGYFVEPTVLTHVQPGSELLSTEIFGPVAALSTFDTVEEVLAAANDTEWGLVGYVITQDVDLAFEVGERLEVGMVGLNTGLVSTPSAPFGGIKHSGLGREGGRLGIEEFLDVKYLSLPIREGARA
ncbi:MULTISPECIES: NAD-dependent succinate-semialdehyde dehydrogenase [unclassified Aeromicrobium]|uniref:NAD-dependent succinate-semialdehyde dehydrogenase n=1 Tax=unclassified Aeromicrobium TaxID=2633570 RepID=UPI002097137D|nr:MULTISPECIES: NAD-dependent succinate-semialdehyde dehydrogenase [unclassified Aeromicrobium]MCO7240363.1 NAD-dependent succinate-semialdehyde dehydrogenase [Aeromicrobium sp. CnD17-E]MDR6117315.1 succinate-semialdehyde dehydrogenase/glutarate-semialdehyde dehydrogenase [Aeromicrobium sp. SORGH_AS_0981]